jgi:arsenite methyltransferase
MFRVLRPGGRVTVSDIVTHGKMSPLVARSLESWAGCVAGALEAETYSAGLEEAGFVDVAVAPREDLTNKTLANLPGGLPFSAIITARKP